MPRRTLLIIVLTVYGIALSASACLRAGTRVDVAWVLDGHELGSFDVTDAVALTPGGGRFGALLDGALDGQLIERAAQQHSRGRLLEWEVSTVDALIAGLPAGGRVQGVLVSGEYFPAELWPVLEARQPFAAVLQLGGDHGDEVTGICVVAGGDRFGDVVPSGLVDAARGRLQAGEVGSTIVEGADGRAVIAVFAPTRRLVVSGGGPIVDALRSAAALLGWKVVVVGDPDSAVGLMATLSALDDAVVMGHDVESSSRVLAAALEGGAGYLGALGSQKMQQQRADWLAYRGNSNGCTGRRGCTSAPPRRRRSPCRSSPRSSPCATVEESAQGRTSACTAGHTGTGSGIVRSLPTRPGTRPGLHREEHDMDDPSIDPTGSARDVLRSVWDAGGDGAADLDEDCSPTKVCRNMRGISFDGFAEEGTDIRVAWRDLLAREGKLSTSGGSIRDLVFGAPDAS